MESEVLASRFKDSDTVELTPFRHQVGGHFAIMNFDELRLAKPAVPRELFFYQTAPKEVCTFIPRYHGEVSMSLVNTVQFLLVFICPQRHVRHALPPPSFVSSQKLSLPTSALITRPARMRVVRTTACPLMVCFVAPSGGVATPHVRTYVCSCDAAQ